MNHWKLLLDSPRALKKKIIFNTSSDVKHLPSAICDSAPLEWLSFVWGQPLTFVELSLLHYH